MLGSYNNLHDKALGKNSVETEWYKIILLYKGKVLLTAGSIFGQFG